MECMELKICMSDKHHRYYKHTKFCQNPRGDSKFLVDLTWNDPIIFDKAIIGCVHFAFLHFLFGRLWACVWFTEIVFIKKHVCVPIYLPIYVCLYAPT